MAELRVDIIADATSALDGMQGFTKSLNTLTKDAAKASNALDDAYRTLDKATPENAAKAFDDYWKAMKDAQSTADDLTGYLNKQTLIVERQGAGVKELTKQYNALGKVMDKLSLMSGNQQSMAIAGVGTIQAGVGAALSDMKASNPAAMSSDDAALAYYRMIGDELGAAQEQLRQYERRLKSLIKTEGENSDAARETAEAYKKQKKEVDNLSAASTKASGRIKNLITSFVSAQAIVYLMQTAINLAVKAVTEWADAAAHAEETANLFNTTFEGVANTANNVAASMASSLGLATSTAQETLGLFGDLAMGYGQTAASALEFAEAASQTALDIMSFKNVSGDVTSIMQTFASGLAGNFENFRKWGIIVTQTEVNSRLAAKGLDKLSGSALQYAKVQETLAIVQEKSANAMGDMEKTLDSTENLNRRVAEANKALSESLGEGINTILNPLKEMWLDIAESINKANDAQELFNAGQKDIRVYDIKGNAGDYEDFKHRVLNSDGSISALDMFNPNPGAFTYTILDENKVLNDLADIMTMFGASALDVIEVLNKYGVEYSSTFASQLKAIGSDIEAEREAARVLEEQTVAFKELQGETVNFIDALAGIQGVSLGHDYAGTVSGLAMTSSSENVIGLQVENAIADALASIDGAGWQDYLSQLDLAFDPSEADGLEKKAEAIQSLYETIYNNVTTGAIHLKDAEGVLNEIVAIWTDTQAQIEALAEDAERLNRLESSITGAQGDAAGIEKQIAQFDMDDAERQLDDVMRAMEEALEDASTESEAESVRQAFNALYQSTAQLVAMQQEQAEQEAFDSALSGVNDSISELERELAGMTEHERELADIEAQRQKALEGITDAGKIAELNAAFDKWIDLSNALQTQALIQNRTEHSFTSFQDGLLDQINLQMYDITGRNKYGTKLYGQHNKAAQDAYDQALRAGVEEWNAYAEASLSNFEVGSEEYYAEVARLGEEAETAKNQIMIFGEEAAYVANEMAWQNIGAEALGSLGGIGDIIGAFTGVASNAAGPWGAVAETMISLASQLEVVTMLTSMLSDAITPIMDAFLKPFVPILESLTSLLSNLLYEILNPFYSFIVFIADALGMVLEMFDPFMSALSQFGTLLGDMLFPVLQMLYPILAIIGEVLSIVGDSLGWLVDLMTVVLAPVLSLVAELLGIVANAFVYVYAAISWLVTIIWTSIQWVIGQVMGGIIDFVNGVIDLINKIPFVNIGHVDYGSYDEWRNQNPWEESKKAWNDALSILEDINKSNMEIADNTGENADLSALEDALAAGLITADEFEGIAAKYTGMDYVYKDSILADPSQYAERQGTTVSYGGVTININGFDGDTRQLAKEIARVLEADSDNPLFDMAI